MIGLSFPNGGVSQALGTLAAYLCALADNAPAGLRGEILDVIAVGAGCKPVAVVGYHAAHTDRIAAIGEAARGHGLATMACTAWTTRGELDDVPAWFAETVADTRKRTHLLAISLLPDRMHALHGDRAATLAPFTETALLGYPTCCTGYHATWRAAVHRRVAEEIMAAAGGNERRARRMASANWAPTPRPGSAFAELLARPTAAGTSIIMCPECENVPMSAARRISATHAGLARRFGLALPEVDRTDHDPTARATSPIGPGSQDMARETTAR